jgi:uracil-DNA glycosylase family 4
MTYLDNNNSRLKKIDDQVVCCRLCPRLISHINQIGKTKIRRFITDDYYAKPLPGFGDSNAQLFIIGLAPAAHGGNRTGRIFTGDSSGDWLPKALFETGFANKPTSTTKNDGLILTGAYITAAVKCAPPQNKPTPFEISNCSQHLFAEVQALEHTTSVILTLGKIAFEAYCHLFKIGKLTFTHGAYYRLGNQKSLLVSYHPSRRNTSTGKLTWEMWIEIFKSARSIVENGN